MPRKAQTSSANGWFAVPQKILNLSSTRTRCGLRSCFSSALMPVIFFSVAVARVAIVSLVVGRWSLVVGRWSLVVGRSLLALASLGWRTTNSQRPTTAFLAGPLGFEPRQSAPKALDLPLVDGPVEQLLTVGSWLSAPRFGSGAVANS